MDDLITIRPAREDDIDAINALFAEEHASLRLLNDYAYNPDLKKPSQKRGELIDLLAEPEPKERYYLAESEGKVVGMIDMSLEENEDTNWMKASRVLWVDDLVVTEAYRGRGIGRRLLEKADEWAAEKKADWMDLTVHAANAAAIELYGAVGFQPFSIRMRKRLS